MAFYLALLRDVQSPVKGQGDRMSGSEGGLQCRNNTTQCKLVTVITGQKRQPRAKGVFVFE